MWIIGVSLPTPFSQPFGTVRLTFLLLYTILALALVLVLVLVMLMLPLLRMVDGQFYDVENQVTLKQTEHFRCNYIEWDPSGRYVCTAVSQPVTGSHWKAQMDNGYQLYTFQASWCAGVALD